MKAKDIKGLLPETLAILEANWQRLEAMGQAEREAYLQRQIAESPILQYFILKLAEMLTPGISDDHQNEA